MTEIRLHGRGGQGTVLVSKALAIAVAQEGKYVQSFPAYGVERRGAPVAAFIRISDTHIYNRYKVYEPSVVVILDDSLIGEVDVIDGIKQNGKLLINTVKNIYEHKIDLKYYNVISFNANSIALKFGLGDKIFPVISTVALGFICAVCNLASLSSIIKAVEEVVPVKVEENIHAAESGYNLGKEVYQTI